MKKCILIAIFLPFVQCSFAQTQWITIGSTIYNSNTGTVDIGSSIPTTINSASSLFPSAIPKLEVVTNTGNTAYSELLLVRHSGTAVGTVSRQLGLVFKLSSESSTGESNKMGGMIVESSLDYSNYPSLSLLTNNFRRLTISASGNVGIGT